LQTKSILTGTSSIPASTTAEPLHLPTPTKQEHAATVLHLEQNQEMWISDTMLTTLRSPAPHPQFSSCSGDDRSCPHTLSATHNTLATYDPVPSEITCTPLASHMFTESSQGPTADFRSSNEGTPSSLSNQSPRQHLIGSCSSLGTSTAIGVLG